jgi:ABC-type phosphate transport system auxiliary subunit
MRRRLSQRYESKISQLDNAIQLLFMDRANGKITDERYDMLSANFEKEQSELKAKLNALDSQLDEMKVREKCVRDFINNAKQYTEIHRLTTEILKTFN